MTARAPSIPADVRAGVGRKQKRSGRVKARNTPQGSPTPLSGVRSTEMWPAAAVALLLIFNLADGLRLMALEVPQRVVSGDETTLTCVFDLEDDTLYSIKWYRDDMEFFRYVPSDKPPNQFFPLQGLDIDFGRSSNGTVYIQGVDETTAGTYKCEISADAPSFQTVYAEKLLTVTVVNDSARLPDPSLLAASFTLLFLCHFTVW